MQSASATQTAASPTVTRRRLLVLVGGPFPGHGDDRASLVLARARGAEALVVAPTLPVAGERWVIDLDARESRARANLRSWVDALAGQAASVRGELGDENPDLAVADALDGFAADEFLDALVPGGPSPARRAPLEQLHDLFASARGAPDMRARHA